MEEILTKKILYIGKLNNQLENIINSNRRKYTIILRIEEEKNITDLYQNKIKNDWQNINFLDKIFLNLREKKRDCSKLTLLTIYNKNSKAIFVIGTFSIENIQKKVKRSDKKTKAFFDFFLL